MKKQSKTKIITTVPRDFVAKAVTRKTGAGPHIEKKYSRKEKHKTPYTTK